MQKKSFTEARDNLAELINQVAYAHDRVILERRGKEVAAIISMQDLAILEKALEEAEDSIDIQESRSALRRIEKEDGIRLNDVLKKRGK